MPLSAKVPCTERCPPGRSAAPGPVLARGTLVDAPDPVPAGVSAPPGRTPAGSRPGRPAAHGLVLPVHALVRQLIAETGRGPARPPGGYLLPPGSRRVLLDVEVDGVRCLLVQRSPPPPAPTMAGSVGRRGVALSPREREIIRLVAQGYPNKAIAEVLDISAWTVCTHLRRVFAKFAAPSRAAVVARFLATENLGVGTGRTTGEQLGKDLGRGGERRPRESARLGGSAAGGGKFH